MRQTTVHLDDEQVQALDRLAQRKGQRIEDLVRQAVDAFLAENLPDLGDWNERFGALIARIQSWVPADVSSEEIEGDITAARAEHRDDLVLSPSRRPGHV